LTSVNFIFYRGEEDPDGTISNIGNLLKAKAEEGVNLSNILQTNRAGVFSSSNFM
jgi:hypothetical protein